MYGFKSLALAAVTGCCLIAASSKPAAAQVSVNIGAAPNCPYGYYDTTPYGCAPYGYYGPEWFSSGVFIGAGPWFHGPANFHGQVNNHFHPEHGYKGPTPHPGDKVETGKEHPPSNFHGNETRDGQGHAGGGPKR
jgi:hypothetical protein